MKPQISLLGIVASALAAPLNPAADVAQSEPNALKRATAIEYGLAKAPEDEDVARLNGRANFVEYAAAKPEEEKPDATMIEYGRRENGVIHLDVVSKPSTPKADASMVEYAKRDNGVLHMLAGSKPSGPKDDASMVEYAH